ncbi:arsenate reductase/protein-tyrosine-phosphatase family protein, partial [Bradyrhizobium sp. Lot11]
MELAADVEDGKRPGAILFMCGLNSIRSPMAEAIARSILPANTYIRSVGVRAGERDP